MHTKYLINISYYYFWYTLIYNSYLFIYLIPWVKVIYELFMFFCFKVYDRTLFLGLHVSVSSTHYLGLLIYVTCA